MREADVPRRPPRSRLGLLPSDVKLETPRTPASPASSIASPAPSPPMVLALVLALTPA